MGRKSNQAVRAAVLVFIGPDLRNAGPVTSHAGNEHGFSMGMTKMRHDPISGCPESRILLVEQLGIAAREVLL